MKKFRLNQEETNELEVMGMVTIYRGDFESLVKWDEYANDYRATIVNDVCKVQLSNGGY